MKNFNCLEEKIKNKSNLSIILDYDGVITTITPEMNSSLFNPIFKRILENFAKKDYLKMNIISDKKVCDFKKSFDIKKTNIKIFGIYGCEVEHLEEHKSSSDDNQCNIMNNFYTDLKKKCKDLERIIIENKKYSVVLHYRLASKTTIDKSKKVFKTLFEKYNSENTYQLLKRNNTLEILPIEIKKDAIIERIFDENPNYEVVYIGDDIELINKTKKIGGFSIGIKPLCEKCRKLVNFSVSQNQLEEFFINTNNLHL